MNGKAKCGIGIQWNIIQPQKRKKILTYATTRMNHENIRLSKLSLPQKKEKYCMIPLKRDTESSQNDRKYNDG